MLLLTLLPHLAAARVGSGPLTFNAVLQMPPGIRQHVAAAAGGSGPRPAAAGNLPRVARRSPPVLLQMTNSRHWAAAGVGGGQLGGCLGGGALAPPCGDLELSSIAARCPSSSGRGAEVHCGARMFSRAQQCRRVALCFAMRMAVQEIAKPTPLGRGRRHAAAALHHLVSGAAGKELSSHTRRDTVLIADTHLLLQQLIGRLLVSLKDRRQGAAGCIVTTATSSSNFVPVRMLQCTGTGSATGISGEHFQMQAAAISMLQITRSVWRAAAARPLLSPRVRMLPRKVGRCQLWQPGRLYRHCVPSILLASAHLRQWQEEETVTSGILHCIGKHVAHLQTTAPLCCTFPRCWGWHGVLHLCHASCAAAVASRQLSMMRPLVGADTSTLTPVCPTGLLTSSLNTMHSAAICLLSTRTGCSPLVWATPLSPAH